MHCVMETEPFARQAARLQLSEDERLNITTTLSENPTLGDLIKETGGARKARFPKPGMGKRGGYRVIYFFAAEDVPVFLLDILDKGERINLTANEKNELKRELGKIAEAYRASQKQKIAQLAKRA